MRYIVVVKNSFWSEQCEAYVYDTEEEAIDCFNYFKGTNPTAMYEAKEIQNDNGVLE